MEFANRIKFYREQLELSQLDLAKRMGYKNKSSISRAENGSDIKPKTLVKYAKALNCTVEDLMGIDSPKNNVDYGATLANSVEDKELRNMIEYYSALSDAEKAIMKRFFDYGKDLIAENRKQ